MTQCDTATGSRCTPRRPLVYAGRRTRRAPTGGDQPGQRLDRDLGATSRVPDQSCAALTVVVCERPAVGAASPISLGSTCPDRPVFGVSSQTTPPSASEVFASTNASTR